MINASAAEQSLRLRRRHGQACHSRWVKTRVEVERQPACCWQAWRCASAKLRASPPLHSERSRWAQPVTSERVLPCCCSAYCRPCRDACDSSRPSPPRSVRDACGSCPPSIDQPARRDVIRCNTVVIILITSAPSSSWPAASALRRQRRHVHVQLRTCK